MSIRVERRTYEVNGQTQYMNIRPEYNDVVKVKTCGHSKEIMYSQKRGRGACIRKLNKTEYVDLRDGEIKEFKKQHKRSDDKISIARSMKLLRDLINANVTEPKNCRWVTLTYADNMQDPKKLYDDFKNFRKRFKVVYGYVPYIVAVEPQGRGAWHLHVILIFDDTAPFIPNQQLRKMWKQGFVWVTALDDVDNVGAYLTAYLGDIPLDEYETLGRSAPLDCNIKECEYIQEDGTKVKKKVVKGARLSLYPAGMRIFRNSRGLKKPEVKYCSEATAAEEVHDMVMTYETTKFLTDEDTGYFNIINYRFYTKKRTGVNIYDSCRGNGDLPRNPHEKQSQTLYLSELQCKH